MRPGRQTARRAGATAPVPSDPQSVEPGKRSGSGRGWIVRCSCPSAGMSPRASELAKIDAAGILNFAVLFGTVTLLVPFLAHVNLG